MNKADHERKRKHKRKMARYTALSKKIELKKVEKKFKDELKRQKMMIDNKK